MLIKYQYLILIFFIIFGFLANTMYILYRIHNYLCKNAENKK